MTALYAVSDLHGHVEELRAALVAEGLLDQEDAWTGSDARCRAVTRDRAAER